MATTSRRKYARVKSGSRQSVCWLFSASVFGLAIISSAAAVPSAKPNVVKNASAPTKKPASLECSALQISATQITLPALDTSATLTLHNTSSSPAVIVKPALGFFTETAKGKWHDVSASVYVESDAANAWFVAPGQSTQLKFKVQFLHDTPAGRLRVLPRIEYFSQADNAFPELTRFAADANNWTVDNPATKFNASATLAKSDNAPSGAENAVQLAVQDNLLKGRITLQSPKSSLRPSTDYVGGILYKSDRSGWDSPINKGAAITEYDDKGAVRAQQLHLFEVPFWSWELTRFKSDAKAAQAGMQVWNRGWALKQNGRSWYSAAFLVSKDKLRVLATAARGPVVSVTASASPNIVFLGDDRPKDGEGGDWLGRYGNESFILCGMQAPQDVVGGRLLPKRRWAKGKDGFAPTAPVWTDWKGEFFYEVLTGDPNEAPRHWIPINELTTKDPRGLVNPLEGGRRYSSWDDRGEVHPFDSKGPDLIVNLEIPKGLHRLALYFIDWDFWNTSRPRAHRLFFSDGNKDEKSGLVSSGYVSDFGQGVYKVYGVAGPSKLRLRIQKDRSVCAVISGIFLDEINLPDSKRVLPVKDEQSNSLRQAAQTYEELRQLQNAPEKLLAASGRMKGVLRLANQVASSGTPDERAAVEWLRWQSTTSLVVAPGIKELAFNRYLALRPPVNAAAAWKRVQDLLEIGEIELARQTAQICFQMAGKYSPSGELAARREAIEWFAKRDTNYACRLVQDFVQRVKACGQKSQMALQMADDLMRSAQAKDLDDAGNTYRAAVACYQAVEEIFGAPSLDEQARFQFALAVDKTPSYLNIPLKRVASYYDSYLRRWPNGYNATRARYRLVELADALTQQSEPAARCYADMGARAATELLEPAKTPNTVPVEDSSNMSAQRVADVNRARGIPTKTASWSVMTNQGAPAMLSDALLRSTLATSAALRMSDLYTRIGDLEEAHRWSERAAQVGSMGSPVAAGSVSSRN